MGSAGASKLLTPWRLFKLTTGKLVLVKSVGHDPLVGFPFKLSALPHKRPRWFELHPRTTDYGAGSDSKCLAHVQWGRNPMEKGGLRVEIAARGMSRYRFPNRSRVV